MISGFRRHIYRHHLICLKKFFCAYSFVPAFRLNTHRRKYMKKIFLLAVLSFLTLNLFAQLPPGGAAKGNAQAANIGHVYGKIVDSLGKPISDASVVLLQSKFDTATKKKKDVLLKGGAATANGEFDFDKLPMFGQLKLK